MDGGFELQPILDLEGVMKKDIGAPLSQLSDVDEDRSFSFVASTDREDRFGDSIAQDWDLEAFSANPVLLWSHQSGRTPIGKVLEFKTVPMDMTKSLPPATPMDPAKPPMMSVARVQMLPKGADPMADLVTTLLGVKFLNAVSVGFLPGKSEERLVGGRWKGGFNYSQNKLIELSVVSVPANQDAVQLARSLGATPLMLRALFSEPAQAVDGPSARVRRYKADLEIHRLKYRRSNGVEPQKDAPHVQTQ